MKYRLWIQQTCPNLDITNGLPSQSGQGKGAQKNRMSKFVKIQNLFVPSTASHWRVLCRDLWLSLRQLFLQDTKKGKKQFDFHNLRWWSPSSRSALFHCGQLSKNGSRYSWWSTYLRQNLDTCPRYILVCKKCTSEVTKLCAL